MKRPFKGGFSGPLGGILMILIVIGVVSLGFERVRSFWQDVVGQEKVPRLMKGEIFGFMPSPTQPALNEPVVKTITPKAKRKKSRKVVVRRIPTLDPKMRMPHPYWGPCIKCHLIKGGAPAGSQPITPVGKMWEKASSTIMKVGPPILPNSTRHHPAAGRCIKCHDIVIEMAM
ncbi:MAG: magnetochrome domain-containing protein [Magnetococcales bacterium]|nr:magnetochrome domain-containing protein [Magnetococcales bacterium]